MNQKVTYQSLTSTATSLETARSTIENSLNTATSEFAATSNAFKSQQSNNIRQKFDELAKEFPSFKIAVDNYAKFLRDTARKYQELDAAK